MKRKNSIKGKGRSKNKENAPIVAPVTVSVGEQLCNNGPAVLVRVEDSLDETVQPLTEKPSNMQLNNSIRFPHSPSQALSRSRLTFAVPIREVCRVQKGGDTCTLRLPHFSLNTK